MDKLSEVFEIAWLYTKAAFGERFQECWAQGFLGYIIYLFGASGRSFSGTHIVMQYAVHLIMGGVSVASGLLIGLVIKDVYKLAIQPKIKKLFENGKREKDEEKRA